MTSTPSGAPDGADDTDGTDATVLLAVSREQLVLAVIVVGQALWLGFVMMRGWYSAADLPNLAFANGRSLDWDYLTSTLGGHFGVAQRFVYWLLNRTAPLEWWVTVLIRLAFQALATVLLWRLLRALIGYRPWLWIVLALYASSAYLVPGIAALNSGLGLAISQACLVGALLAQVRFHRGRRLVDAVVVALLVLVMLAFAQEAFPTLVILPILSFVFLQQGPWRERLPEVDSACGGGGWYWRSRWRPSRVLPGRGLQQSVVPVHRARRPLARGSGMAQGPRPGARRRSLALRPFPHQWSAYALPPSSCSSSHR